MATLTKERCLVMVGELLEHHRATVMEQAEKYLKTGAINWQEYEDNYRLPKILVTAALHDKRDIFQSPRECDKETVRNLEHF